MNGSKGHSSNGGFRLPKDDIDDKGGGGGGGQGHDKMTPPGSLSKIKSEPMDFETQQQQQQRNFQVRQTTRLLLGGNEI